MAELPPARVVEFLDGIPPGEVRCVLARGGGPGGRGREGDPDPVDVGSDPVPRSAVRLVALERRAGASQSMAIASWRSARLRSASATSLECAA